MNPFSTNIFKSSWKTTIGGIALGLSLMFGKGHLEAYFDTDPETIPDWTFVWAGVAAVWTAIFARDNSVSDEQAGAGVKPPQPLLEIPYDEDYEEVVEERVMRRPRGYSSSASRRRRRPPNTRNYL